LRCANHGEGLLHSVDEGVLSEAAFRYGGWVLWLGKPPYLKWLAAGALTVAAFVWDLSERATEPFPFAASDLVRGQPITAVDVEWRELPSGALVLPELVDATASVTIRLGDPIVPSLVSSAPPLPAESWAVPLPLPIGAAPGTAVKLVFADGTDITGVVIQSASEDPLGFATTGLVAVTGQAVNAVALAAANGDLVVLIEP
jgi:hypothetical protein